MRPLLISLVPIGALAALGGASPSSTLPILAASVTMFLVARARIAADDTRALDLTLLALVAGVALQAVPLPASFVAAVSPQADTLRSTLYLDPTAPLTTLSVNAQLTRAALATLLSALLVFWAAREIFSHGGIRVAARAVAWAGFALSLLALAARATAPDLLLWTWQPVDAESQPFGPFVNRNHFATWSLMAGTLTAGYLVSHTVSHASTSPPVLRLRVRDWLADGNGLLLAGALVALLAGLMASLSRAALLGAAAALVAGVLLSRSEQRGRTVRLAAVAVVFLLAVGAWSNREGLARKFGSPTTISRTTIWRDTLPIVADFWATGTGAGTYGVTMLQYQASRRDVHFNQAHSEYVQVAAEGGLLLLAPLVAALIAGLRLAHRRVREDTRLLAWIRIGAAAGLVGIAVQGLFETGLRVPANALLAAVLAAIVLHSPRASLSGTSRARL